ncbi:DUF433 domain-containing protein [Longimicrobium sp.]|jgi:uncharacterized protein (DUF433 family)|uniref:DUF433 domain-containing protein n=1 Tax=Longimicrobium sp. TaxID=2029185 RepID=UPI002ED90449
MRRSIYGGRDPRDLPAYRISDAARYLHVPAATLRSWFAGRTYPRQQGGPGSFKRLINPADEEGCRLSFLNLVEAHVLRALRTEHGIALHAVRSALDYAENKLGIEHVLLSDSLLTGAGEVFLDHYGHLISLSRSGQIAIRRVLEMYLRRVERDDRHIPLRLFPFLSEAQIESQSVVIDPRISFGRPIINGSGITTSILVRRVDAGETVEHLAHDYGLSADKIADALVFEKAA